MCRSRYRRRPHRARIQPEERSIGDGELCAGITCVPTVPSGMAMAVVGRSTNLERTAAVWERGARAAVAALLGYPQCCNSFLAQLVEERRLDATWSVAQGTGHVIEQSHIGIRAIPQTNLLWAPLGITLMPDIPCDFGCDAGRHVVNG